MQKQKLCKFIVPTFMIESYPETCDMTTQIRPETCNIITQIRLENVDGSAIKEYYINSTDREDAR